MGKKRRRCYCRLIFSLKTAYNSWEFHTFASEYHTFDGKMSGCQIEKDEEVDHNAMKKTYHLCLSAGEEILFRDSEDYNRGFNCLAVALFNTNSTGLVEAFMSTHTHQMIQTESPADLMYNFRMRYSMYFNRKYHRAGKLGEKMHFTLEVVGYNHMLAAASYILRNPLHHGIVPIPYAYHHSSVNSIFLTEMGKQPCERILSHRYHRNFIGKGAEYPATYKMSENGVFLRETVLDIPQVENMFVTPRAFNWYMTRKSSEEWETEQKKDQNGHPPIILSNIEQGIKTESIDKMLIYESGRSDYRRPSDIDICMEIDRNILPEYGKPSVYLLTIKEKQQIAEYLYRRLHINESQIRRCLAM